MGLLGDGLEVFCFEFWGLGEDWRWEDELFASAESFW